jgi:hypothetical protein
MKLLATLLDMAHDLSQWTMKTQKGETCKGETREIEVDAVLISAMREKVSKLTSFVFSRTFW